MEIIQMTGLHAYANYCAAYNDCAPSSIPRFTNVNDFMKRAESLIEEDKIRNHHKEHFVYLVDKAE